MKSILFQDLSAASNEINTRPRLCLTLVLKSMLPNIVSAASSQLLVENYFLMYVSASDRHVKFSIKHLSFMTVVIISILLRDCIIFSYVRFWPVIDIRNSP